MDIFSRIGKFLISRGHIFADDLSSKNSRGQIFVDVNIEKHLLLQKYEEIVKTLYTEPKNEIIVGCYLSNTNHAVKRDDPVVPKKKKRNTKGEVKSRDIRDMLKN